MVRNLSKIKSKTDIPTVGFITQIKNGGAD